MKTSIPLEQPKSAVLEERSFLKVPSYLIEIAYLALLVYANLGPAYGLAIPIVGAGLLAGLAILCIMHFGSHFIGAVRPIKLALGCAISILFIQGIFYEESLGGGQMRSFVTWILSLIIIQSLSLRKGFLHRFALVAFLIGCATLPFMRVYVATDDMIRVGGEGGVALGNPNYFGMWFGFCTIYFIISGLETKNYIVRMASWSMGMLCLYLMALSVSRGSLLGVAIATVIAFQKVLKRSFLPILGILCLVWFVYVLGIFDNLIVYYLNRGTEESGRSRLWAWAFAGFLESWWAGVGLSNALIIDGDRAYGPHNSFLFIGLSSGIIPLVFYIAYLFQIIRGALRARIQQRPDSPYILPWVSFAILALMVADGTFMSPWHVVVFSAALGTANVNRKPKRQFGNTPTGNFTRKESAQKFPSSSLSPLRKK